MLMNMGLKATLPASTTIIFSDLLPWNLFKDYKWLWFVRMHFFLETYINIKHHVWLFPILFNCIVALLWSIYLVPNASFPLGVIGKSNRSIKHWLVSFEWSEARKSPMFMLSPLLSIVTLAVANHHFQTSNSTFAGFLRWTWLIIIALYKTEFWRVNVKLSGWWVGGC